MRSGAQAFSIARWSCWEASAEAPKAEVPELAPLLRRRASNADRAALRVAFDCVGAKAEGSGASASLPAVFASRHGEVQRSVELLEELVAQGSLSPMNFSLSVHNSAAGLYSITRGDRSPMAAIAAGRESLSQAMLEALGSLASGASQVLVVAYDDLLPEAFKPYADEEDKAYALGLLLKPGADYSLELASSEATPLQDLPEALQVASFLKNGGASLVLQSPPRQWTWARHA
jgi:hypothetical protein